MSRFPSIRLASLVLGLALPAALFASAAQPTPLARVGDQDIDAATLRSLLPPLDPVQRKALAADTDAQARLVRSLLVRRLLVGIARDNHWDQNPTAQLQMKQAEDNALADSYLTAVCKVPDDYPSDKELHAFYDDHADTLRTPERYHLAQLYIAAPADSADATKVGQTKLDKVEAALAKPDADFSNLARRYSDSTQSAVRGGDIGWVTEAQLRPELRAVLADLKPGQVSKPVRLADGWYLVKCLESKPAAPLDFDQIHDALAQRMRAERVAANRKAFMEQLLKANPVSLNELALHDLLAAPSS